MHDRRIDAGLPHGRHMPHLGEKTLRPFAGLVVHIPVERGREHQALRGLQPEPVDIGDQNQQASHLLAAGEQAELAAELYGVDVVGRTAGEPDDFRL